MTTAYTLYHENVLVLLAPEFILPDVKDPATWGGWDNVFMDKAGKYVFGMSAALKSPYYNTAQVSPDKIAQLGLKTLLDPAYKGKILWHDPLVSGSGQTFAYVLRTRLGDDALRQLILDQKIVFMAQQDQVVEAMARGVGWIGIGPFVRAHLEPYLAAGVKMDVRAFGNDPSMNEMGTGGAGLYVYNKRPHPNATRVFVNWILSKDIQLGLAKATLRIYGARICPPSPSRSASRSKARIISRPSARSTRRIWSMRSNSSATFGRSLRPNRLTGAAPHSAGNITLAHHYGADPSAR